jgi:hypothetical protein
MKIEYKDKLVAFVDVLGFSDIVNNSHNEKIESYYTYLESNFKDHISKTGLQYLFISDSIVILADESKENIFELTRLLTKIQCGLLLNNIVLRGAISFGNLYINKEGNIIVGNGLIRAYNLEKQAVNPRIILDRQLISKYFKGSDDFISCFTATTKAGYKRNYVKMDADNYPYINYFHYFVEQQPTYKQGGIDKSIKLFNDNYYNNIHFTKYHWLLSKLIIELEALNVFQDKFSVGKKIASGTVEKIKQSKEWLAKLKNL